MTAQVRHDYPPTAGSELRADLIPTAAAGEQAVYQHGRRIASIAEFSLGQLLAIRSGPLRNLRHMYASSRCRGGVLSAGECGRPAFEICCDSLFGVRGVPQPGLLR